MLPIALPRHEIEILLDSPNQRDYVVSAYADMKVQDGFRRLMERHLNNKARAARESLTSTEARKDLDANIDAIRDAMRAHAGSEAKGLAVFSGAARGLRRVIPLGFPVEDRLVIDEEPFLLPILEHWYGDPLHLIVLADSNEAHLFEADRGPSATSGGTTPARTFSATSRDSLTRSGSPPRSMSGCTAWRTRRSSAGSPRPSTNAGRTAASSG
jgi:hypothetical protein